MGVSAMTVIPAWKRASRQAGRQAWPS